MIANLDPMAAKAESKVTLGEIEKLAARLADATTGLDEQLTQFETELQAVNEKHLRPLKRLATLTAQAEAELRTAIEAGAHLFIKPRTLTMHGIKLGFSVSEGKLVFDDADSTVALIKKHFPDDIETLVRKSEEPNKDNIKALDLDEKGLRRIGCKLEDAGEMVLVKSATSDIEKLLTKLKTKLVEAMVAAE